MKSRFFGLTGLLAALAAGFLLIAPDFADAKLSKSGGAGSRGSKSQMAPPATQTAPRSAMPIQNNAAPRAGMPANSAMAANATRPGMFGSMSKGGFMAGLLGAGALGLLLGYGLSGGLGGLGAMLGLMLQIALFAGLAFLAFSWWQRRKQQNDPAYARAAAPGGYGQQPGAPFGGQPQGQAQSYDRSGSALGAMGVGAGAGAATGGMFGQPQQQQEQEQVPTRPLTLVAEDFAAFEKVLSGVHEAFAKEDHTALRQFATEEMADYFAQDIAQNVRENRALRLSDVRLEQGDLAEAWKEPNAEYATVAMRFSMIEQILDRHTGKATEGNGVDRSEVTEIWTFVRPAGGKQQDWQLSAIQEAEQEAA